MPWKVSSVMDERMRFVIRLKDGESMASLCREFGISRKTGYKIFERYEECGLEGLSDRLAGRSATLTSCPSRSKRQSWQPSARSGTGELARFASACCGDCRTPSESRPAARSMPCWTATDWSPTRCGRERAPRARLCRKGFNRTIYGRPITRTSSCWANVTAIR